MDFCHNAYYYAAHYFTAIIGNYLLIIYYIKYKNSDEAVVYDIVLIPNVDNISLELKSDYISTQARIVDSNNNAITIWTPFTNLEHKKTGKMSLSELLEPVTLEEMKNKIDMIILREGLVERISKLNDDDIKKIIQYLNSEEFHVKEPQKRK